MTRPTERYETADDLRAALRRNHPELTDDAIDRILTGEPCRYGRHNPRSRPFIDNRGKRASRYETPSAGRTTPARTLDRDQGDR